MANPPQNLPSSSPSKKARRTKSLRNWLQVLAAIAIPIVIAVFGYYQNQTSLQLSDKQHTSDQKIAQANRQNDLQIADDQQQEVALKAYLDDISTLLLQDNLRNSRPTDEVRQIARAKTLAALSRLDGQRKGVVIRFLYETGLISVSTAGPVVSLYNADLTGAKPHGGELQGVNLVRANLYKADLSDGNLSKANLSYANLNEAILARANLKETILDQTHLVHADLRGADLKGAYLYTANKPNVIILTSQLEQQTTLLSGTIMPDGSRHP